jgi:hypothetical protein
MKPSNYMTRALQAKDGRFAVLLGKLGYARDTVEKPSKARDPLDHDGDGRKGGSKPGERGEAIDAQRAAYQAKFGKRPYHGWDAETIAAKIAEAGE